MRSTKYDKKGSVLGDLVKPLESLLYRDLRECETYCSAVKHMRCLSALESLRTEIPEIAKSVVHFMCMVDDGFRSDKNLVFIQHSWEGLPCPRFRLKKHILCFIPTIELRIYYFDRSGTYANYIQSISNWKINFPAHLKSAKKIRI